VPSNSGTLPSMNQMPYAYFFDGTSAASARRLRVGHGQFRPLPHLTPHALSAGAQTRSFSALAVFLLFFFLIIRFLSHPFFRRDEI